MLIDSAKKHYDYLESERYRIKRLPEDHADKAKLPQILRDMKKLQDIDKEPELPPIPKKVLEISHLARYSKIDNKSKKLELAKHLDELESLIRADERSKYI